MYHLKLFWVKTFWTFQAYGPGKDRSHTKQPDPSLSLHLAYRPNLTQFLAMYEAPTSAGQLYVHPAPRVG
jgi:hypothetical protein